MLGTFNFFAAKGSNSSAGTSEHKSGAWAEYQARGGQWGYDRWSKVYDLNMTRAINANAAVDDYFKELGWGKREVTVYPDGTTPRRLDIADVAGRRGIEYKTGYVYNSEEIASEVSRDSLLVQKGWNIQWVIDGHASDPLLEALQKAGISVSLR